MLDWFKSKELPDFWLEYIEKFKETSEDFVVFQILQTKTDLLAISLLFTSNNKVILNTSQTFYLESKKNATLIDTENSSIETLSTMIFIEKFVKYIGNSFLIGYNTNVSTELITKLLKNNSLSRLRNNVLDIEIMFNKYKETNHINYSLSEMCKELNIPQPMSKSIFEEVLTISLIFINLKQKLNISNK